MKPKHLLAVVAVSDFDASHEWYRSLFDADATNVPMAGSLAEWRLTDTGWLQMYRDPERAGTSLFNLAVDNLDQHVEDLHGRDIATDEIIEADRGVRLCSLHDPDGNTITFIGGFREEY